MDLVSEINVYIYINYCNTIFNSLILIAVLTTSQVANRFSSVHFYFKQNIFLQSI